MGDYGGKTAESLLKEIGGALRKNAFTVFLFDEVEKAPRYIQEALLSVMDSDTMTLAESLNGSQADGPKSFTKIKTINASMFFATNAGQDKILTHSNIDPLELRNAMVADGFSEFLLDRCRDIHVFFPPKTREEFRAVAQVTMRARIKSLEEQKNMRFSISNEDEFLSSLTDKYFNPRSGFRGVLTEVDNVISLSLANKIAASSKPQCSFLFDSLVLESVAPKFNIMPRGVGFHN
ncbi:MAG: hypothetical protein A4S09_03890 [Proteobacteria bacterium SG_bin7]|nr:MAG: hypothetical protein A4S09_03890 [Proteobacteria bacterium SG_bin7]